MSKPGIIVRRNRPSTPLRWARSATRHRISRERSRYVIETCFAYFKQSGTSRDSDDRLIFLGDDAEGVALEVMAVELADEGLLVIHAMKLRDRYRAQYEETKRWGG